MRFLPRVAFFVFGHFDECFYINQYVKNYGIIIVKKFGILAFKSVMF